MPRRVPVLPGLVLCLLVGLAAPAWAGPWVDRTAGGLRDDPLYVHASARPTLTAPAAGPGGPRLALARPLPAGPGRWPRRPGTAAGGRRRPRGGRRPPARPRSRRPERTPTATP